MNESIDFTIIVPVFNEEGAISETIENILQSIITNNYELLIINDGSTDSSGKIINSYVEKFTHIRMISCEFNRGYGASLKLGVRSAKAEIIAIVDADGSYPIHDISKLIAAISNVDMVVGSRTGENVEYSRIRKIPKIFLKSYVSWIAGQNVPDMNSGMRVLRKPIVEKYIGILPDTFSFTTTITLAMLTNSYNVKYIPINYTKRVGKSKIQPIRDTLRFIQLIIRTGVYFAPMRVLTPLIIVLFAMFICSLIYDVVYLSNLTDKTVLLIMFTLNTGLFALIADMIDKRMNK